VKEGEIPRKHSGRAVGRRNHIPHLLLHSPQLPLRLLRMFDLAMFDLFSLLIYTRPLVCLIVRLGLQVPRIVLLVPLGELEHQTRPSIRQSVFLLPLSAYAQTVNGRQRERIYLKTSVCQMGCQIHSIRRTCRTCVRSTREKSQHRP
jgi:hypothetical protein